MSRTIINGSFVMRVCLGVFLSMLSAGILFGQATDGKTNKVAANKGKKNVVDEKLEKIPDGQGPLYRVRNPLSQWLNLGVTGAALSLDTSKMPAVRADQSDRIIPKFIIAPGGGMKIIKNGIGLGMERTPIMDVIAEIEKMSGAKTTAMQNSEDLYTVTMNSQDMACFIEQTALELHFTFEETTTPKRKIDFSSSTSGYFDLKILRDKNEVLSIIQKESGKISVSITIDPNHEALKIQDDTFAQLYLNNQIIMENQVYPLLQKFGLGLEISVACPTLQHKALEIITPMDKSDVEQAWKLIKELDANEYEVRKAAGTALTDNYTKYKPVIFEAVKNPSNSAEVSERLKVIIKAHPENENTEKYLQSLKLLENPLFLVRLLAIADAKQKPHVVSKLETVTGQKLGDDVTAWEKWLEKNTSPQTIK